MHLDVERTGGCNIGQSDRNKVESPFMALLDRSHDRGTAALVPTS